MKTLFTDIYNKILELFQIERSENTSECATNRLQVILMHDRTKLDPLIMNKMREELIEVFSKYVVIDKDELEIGLKNEGDAVALMLNIPVVRAKTEEELEAIRKKLSEEEKKVKDDDEEENADIKEEADDKAKETEEKAEETAEEADKEEISEKEEAKEKPEEEIKEDTKKPEISEAKKDDEFKIIEEPKDSKSKEIK